MALGVFLLIAAGSSVAVHVWLSTGVWLAIPRETGTEFIFVSNEFSTLAVLLLTSCTIVLLLHGLVRQTARLQGPQPPLGSVGDVAYALPLCGFSVSALALLNLVPGVGDLLSVWSYAIVDLRWWWSVLLLAWVLMRVDLRLHGALGLRAAGFVRRVSRHRRVPEIAAVILAVTWVVAGTSHLRFSGITAGDEAKFLRYCELLYQGQGFELSSLKPIPALPDDFQPQPWRSVILLGQTLPGELRSLAEDIGTFVMNPSHHFNQARKEGGFFEGKPGGVYQVHTPGISFLMFPAYYLDRQLGGPGPNPEAQRPERLIAVNTFFLAVYALWVLLMFRFLQRAVESTAVAWITTVALMLTLPVAAFPFQFYSETVAGVILVGVAGHLFFPTRRSLPASIIAGLAAGYLPWLHARFSALAFVLVVAGVFILRADRRRAAGFLAGAVASLGSVSLYAHYLTGSILPWAMWHEASGRAVLTLSGALWGSVAYLIDRDWGLFAHAPVYLLALPGYVWMARRRPDIAWLSGIAFLSLLLPAAGHTLTAAGGSPMRLIVAAVPFAAVPLAELLARRGRSPVVQVSFALLLLVSLHTALAYNLHHYKDVGRLVDQSFSGWNVHLAFPQESRAAWEVSASNGWLFWAWTLGLIALTARSAMRRGRPGREWSRAFAAAAGVLVFLLLGTAVAAATGVWQDERFRLSTTVAATNASHLLERMNGCALCLSSDRPLPDTAAMERVLATLAPQARPEKEYAEWLKIPRLVREWYFEANGVEPSTEDIGHHLFQWREERVPPEEIRRRIFESAGAAPVPEP